MKPLEPGETDYSQTSVGITDLDVRNTLHASMRLLVIFSVLAAALFWWRANWQSAVLLVLGAIISATSLWEWLRLITAINQRMDAGLKPGQKASPMGLILLGFFTRLGLTLVVLYVSLKYLHGTVFALAAGLGLGLLSLTIEALRLMRRGTV